MEMKKRMSSLEKKIEEELEKLEKKKEHVLIFTPIRMD